MSKRSEILRALENGNELEIRKFFHNYPQIDINATDRNGDTLLHHAIRLGNESSIKALLDLQANPNIKNIDGKTPLDFAQSLGKEIAESTAFQLDEHLRIEMIRRGFNKENEAFVSNLVIGGANPFTKDEEGKTAIDLAQNNSKRKALLQKTLEEESLRRLINQTGVFNPPVGISKISERINMLKARANKLKETLSKPIKDSLLFSKGRKNSQKQNSLR